MTATLQLFRNGIVETQITGIGIGAHRHSHVSKPTEIVFSTAMVGYTEALTDPSYYGQFLVFSYPLIGNYGIPPLLQNGKMPLVPPIGFESFKSHVAGVVIGTHSTEAFHYNSEKTLDVWLKEQGIPGIVGIDTRALIHRIRDGRGAIRASLKFENGPNPTHELLHLDLEHEQVIDAVSTHDVIRLGKGRHRIHILDCGIKWNMIRELLKQDVELAIFPWNANLQDDCDGWLISNGPGDPKNTGSIAKNVSKLLENDQRPIFGICLGHQLLALSIGADTERLEYGHRSHNQPVVEIGADGKPTGHAMLTSQNHGYVVIETTIPKDWNIWFRNANDLSIEGIRHRSKPFRSVQFHPEAAGGPRDASRLLTDFVNEVKTSKARNK